MIDYWACLSIMMVYQKHLNDLKDGKKISKAYLLTMEKAWKKACKKYPQAHVQVCKALQKNYELEDRNSPDAEQLAANFGQLAAELVSNTPANPARSSELSEVLEKIARLIGEWIYFIDFYDDVEEDLRTKQHAELKEIDPIAMQEYERIDVDKAFFTTVVSPSFFLGILNTGSATLPPSNRLL